MSTSTTMAFVAAKLAAAAADLTDVSKTLLTMTENVAAMEAGVMPPKPSKESFDQQSVNLLSAVQTLQATINQLAALLNVSEDKS